MIEIITEKVNIPTNPKFQKDKVNNKWVVVDTENNDAIRYRGKWEDVCIACHNLNKKHYLQNK
jgi:hypothetical protein